MPRLRSVIKRVIAYALYYSGALWLYAALVLRNRAVVLMYHRVLPAGADTFSDDGIIVTPETFEANMRFLRRHFVPLTAAGFRECLERGSFPRRACLVTFDDGWQDNAVHTLPVLRNLGVPAAIFVATGYLGTDRTFWQEDMSRRLFAMSRGTEPARRLLEELNLSDACVADAANARRIVREFVTTLKTRGSSQVERVASLIAAAGDRPSGPANACGDDRFMSWDEVGRMASSGVVCIGSHAHSHIPLTQLGPERALSDLLQSIREIAERALPAPWLCAYPNGDFDDDVVHSVRAAGLELGFTTQPGRVAPDADRLRLPRVNVHENAASSEPEFLCRILGVF